MPIGLTQSNNITNPHGKFCQPLLRLQCECKLRDVRIGTYRKAWLLPFITLRCTITIPFPQRANTACKVQCTQFTSAAHHYENRFGLHNVNYCIFPSTELLSCHNCVYVQHQLCEIGSLKFLHANCIKVCNGKISISFHMLKSPQLNIDQHSNKNTHKYV